MNSYNTFFGCYALSNIPMWLDTEENKRLDSEENKWLDSEENKRLDSEENKWLDSEENKS